MGYRERVSAKTTKVVNVYDNDSPLSDLSTGPTTPLELEVLRTKVYHEVVDVPEGLIPFSF